MDDYNLYKKSTNRDLQVWAVIYYDKSNYSAL